MRQGDMLVPLMNLPPEPALPEGLRVHAACPGDKTAILAFVREHFSVGWADECEVALSQMPPTCFIAVKDGILVGFACCESSAKGFFGPIGVAEDARGLGIGAALLLRALHHMREIGYIYAVIGWVGSAAAWYQKLVDARWIDGGEPAHSVYQRYIHPVPAGE